MYILYANFAIIIMKRVLIITYYWPPAGGGGVQRWLKMTKYFEENGWQPIVYTPSNPEIGGYDESLIDEIHPNLITIKSPIWEPYDLYKVFTGKKKEEKIYSGFIQSDKKSSKLAQKISNFIRGNFFIPDARRFWIRPGISFLNTYLRDNHVDAIISTGPPHTTHVIAMSVAKTNNLPWVADFRDPWTQIDFYDKLSLTYFADLRHKSLEKKVLKSANTVVTVSNSWAKDLAVISQKQNVNVITNGYDPADFDVLIPCRNDKFVICHMGSMNSDRNPVALWQVLSDICTGDLAFAEKLEIALIGPVYSQIFVSLEVFKLTKYLRIDAFVPHVEAIQQMKSSHLLLLCINNTDNKGGILPGKMYEYIGANRDILCVGPSTGDAVDILSTCQPESIAQYDDKNKIKEIVIKSYNRFINQDYSRSDRNGLQYSRQVLADKYCRVLDSLV